MAGVRRLSWRIHTISSHERKLRQRLPPRDFSDVYITWHGGCIHEALRLEAQGQTGVSRYG